MKSVKEVVYGNMLVGKTADEVIIEVALSNLLRQAKKNQENKEEERKEGR